MIDKLTVLGWKKTEGAYGFNHAARVALILDQGDQWWKDIKHHGPQEWAVNQWTPQMDLASYGNLNIRIFQYLSTPLLGTATYRDGYITVEGTYLTDLPPQFYDVNVSVKDSETLAPIPSATVFILSGTQIMAQGKTDYQGQLTLGNVSEGEYTLKAFRSGYVSREQRLEVAGVTHADISMIKSLGPDWERYVGYAAVGVGLYAGYRILTAPETGKAYSRAKQEIEKRRR
ncbi:unnamed protein product [marine sediment metagenome]|uniref:PEGA domain-containing protein n=1 Tax=marine sediment metagenome TaxID=412755 RepID=X1B297_9ZZZZ